jgi:hypothetical protein
MRIRVGGWVGTLTFVFGLLVLDILSWQNWVPDFDQVAYAATIAANRTSDFRQIQEYAYGEMREQVSEHDYRLLTGEPNGVLSEPRRLRASDPVFFVEHLPFWSIHPLYTALLLAMADCGLNCILGERVIGMVMFFVLGLVWYFWTRRYVNVAIAVVAGGVLFASSSVLILARLPSPDAMATTLTMAGVALVYMERIPEGLILLLASVYVRTDAVLFALPVLALAVYWHNLKGWHAGVLALVAIASVLLINHCSGNYGWAALLRFTWLDKMINPDVSAQISPAAYFHILLRGTGSLLLSGGGLLAFLAIVAASRNTGKFQQLVLAFTLACLVRFLIFPHYEDRYFSAPYLIFGTGALADCSWLPRLR